MILIFLIFVIGIFVFILTLDMNRYKPILIGKIESIIGRDVKISNISLDVFPRTVIRMNGVSIKDSDRSWDEAILKAGSLEATIKLLPLLRKDVQIENLTIRESTVNLADLAVGSLPDFKLNIIEATFKNVSFYGPIYASGKLSLFGRGRENINLKAILYPEIETKKPYLRNVEVRVDLDRFDIVALLDALKQPGIAQKFIGKDLGGKLVISSEEIYLDPKKIYDSNIYIDFSDGTTDIVPVKDGIGKIQLKAVIREENLIIEKITGLIAGGRFSVKGVVRDLPFRQKINADIVLEDIRIEDFLPDAAPGQPYMEGELNINMESSLQGLRGEKLLETLIAKGIIGLRGIVLNNMNILAESLNELNMLPGLLWKLKARLPERYKELLRQDDTTFKPLEIEFDFKDGKLLFKDFLVESDAFYIKGQGSLDIDGGIVIYSNIFIPKDLSAAFIGVVRELKYLQNSEGMITMPLTITGAFPDIEVKPDLNYVISRLAVSKGRELLESIFKKQIPQEPEGSSSTSPGREGSQTQGGREEIRPEEAIIRTIFDIIGMPRE